MAHDPIYPGGRPIMRTKIAALAADSTPATATAAKKSGGA